MTPGLLSLADKFFPTHTKQDLQELQPDTTLDTLLRNTPHRLTHTRLDDQSPESWEARTTDNDTDTPDTPQRTSVSDSDDGDSEHTVALSEEDDVIAPALRQLISPRLTLHRPHPIKVPSPPTPLVVG